MIYALLSLHEKYVVNTNSVKEKNSYIDILTAAAAARSFKFCTEACGQRSWQGFPVSVS
jgi:mitochondrial fission protein ELM1